jgi:hypothetical protein
MRNTVQLLCRFQADGEMPIPGAIVGKGLHLHEERGHEVEGHPHAGELLQDRNHAVVVLDRMQSYPGEDVLAGGEILVIGLMHVPENGQPYHGR